MTLTASQKRTLKSRLVLTLEEKGFRVVATDSPDIVLFTNKKINSKSHKYSTQKNLREPYMTSFGEVGAKKLITELSKRK